MIQGKAKTFFRRWIYDVLGKYLKFVNKIKKSYFKRGSLSFPAVWADFRGPILSPWDYIMESGLHVSQCPILQQKSGQPQGMMSSPLIM